MKAPLGPSPPSTCADTQSQLSRTCPHFPSEWNSQLPVEDRNILEPARALPQRTAQLLEASAGATPRGLAMLENSFGGYSVMGVHTGGEACAVGRAAGAESQDALASYTV